MRIFLVGFSGAGKTYWGKKWGQTHKINYYDLDDVIMEAQGLTVSEIFEKLGETEFRKLERKALESFFLKDDFILSCGGGTPCFFDNMEKMNELGTTIHLHAEPDQIYQRIISETEKRPLLKKMQPSEIRLFIEQKLKEREPAYHKAKFVVDTKSINEDTLRSLLDSMDAVIV